jgi:hypothetical protein
MNRRYPLLHLLGFICISCTGCTGAPQVDGAEAPDPRAVRNLATKVADWQLGTFEDAADVSGHRLGAI